MQGRIAWDDLVFILSVGRNGSLAGAARELRVNHSTVFRRIGAIESKLGVRLFDRRRDGYVPTSAGEIAVDLARRLDRDVHELERRLAGEDLRPSGTVRIATTESILDLFLPVCHAFQRAYPEIDLELSTGTQMVNLSRRDADVALRPSSGPPAHLFGRRIGKIVFAPYASTNYLAHRAVDSDLGHEWLGLDDTLAHVPAYRWLQEQPHAASVRFRVSSFLTLRQACIKGMGVALLPCYMVEPRHDLQPVGPPVAAAASELWLLVHKDIRRTARIRAFLDFAFEELNKLKPRFEAEHLI